MKGERDFFENFPDSVMRVSTLIMPRGVRFHSIAKHSMRGNEIIIPDGGSVPENYSISVVYQEGDLVDSDGKYDYIHAHNNATISRYGIPCRVEKITR